MTDPKPESAIKAHLLTTTALIGTLAGLAPPPKPTADLGKEYRA